MPPPRIHLTIDIPLLSLPSHDTLVLSRRVNGAFTTALAVASLNPPSSSSPNTTTPTTPTPPLYSHNIFAWSNAFRVAVSHRPPASAPATPLAASLTNAVDIAHGETARFARNVLLPPSASPAATTALVNNMRELSLSPASGVSSSSGGGGNSGSSSSLGSGGRGGGGGGSACVFSVADVPPGCRVEVMQVVTGQGAAARVWQSEEVGLARVVEVCVEEQFVLYWTERQVALGGRVVVSEHEGFRRNIGEHDDVVFVRYGFATPNQPKGNEMPGWYEQSAGCMMVDDSAYSLVRIAV